MDQSSRESTYELSFDWCSVDKVELSVGTQCEYSSGPWGWEHHHRPSQCGNKHPDMELRCIREGNHDNPGLGPADWLGNTDHGAMYRGNWKWWPNKHKPSNQQEML